MNVSINTCSYGAHCVLHRVHCMHVSLSENLMCLKGKQHRLDTTLSLGTEQAAALLHATGRNECSPVSVRPIICRRDTAAVNDWLKLPAFESMMTQYHTTPGGLSHL